MHAIAIRNDVADQYSWLTKALFDAYSQSKQLAYDAINKSGYYMTALPWFAQEAESTRASDGRQLLALWGCRESKNLGRDRAVRARTRAGEAQSCR